MWPGISSPTTMPTRQAQPCGRVCWGALSRHVAMYPRPLPDATAVHLLPGDRILLSSDGLHGVVDDAALARTLDSHPEATDACAALIEAALQAGGPDNITALVIDIANE